MVVVGSIVAVIASARPLAAQQTSESSLRLAPAPVAAAARRTGPIIIDGKLDEAAWNSAIPVTQFRQNRPHEGAPATLGTELRFLFDDDALYIGARMLDPRGAREIHAPLARRDQLLDSNGNNGAFNSLTTDKLVVVLDPYHNHIDQAWFEINPAGVKGDQFDGDPSWDPIWEGATHIDSLGWTAEIRIPYSQLRFSRDSLQSWGMQILRYADQLNEHDMWAFRRNNEAGGPAYFGQLTGILIGARPRQFELLPYIESREQLKRPATGDPYHIGNHDTRMSAGADLKYLLTSNLTLDATINPDFGQVEVDPATINLTAFETQYAEKRPFFVAGSSAFAFGGSDCMFCSNSSTLAAFYSRRIGRVPQLNGYVTDLSNFADTPDNTTILGAAKISGRTGSGYTIGLLDAVTNRETARYQIAPNTGNTGNSGNSASLPQDVEPLTNYFVGRATKDLREGATTIGGVLTMTGRRIDDSVMADKLRSHAEVGGLDWSHHWHKRDYSWTGSVVSSNVAGSPKAILLTEQSSAHYFQRLDRKVTSDGLFNTRYDSTATSLRGYGFDTRVAKDNGDWLWEVAQRWHSPGLELNDLSYLTHTDTRWMSANLSRQWTTPGRWYRDINILAGGQQQFNYDGDRTSQQLQTFAQIDLLNYWRLRGYAMHRPSEYDDQLTRGGPVVTRTGSNYGDLEITTDPRGRAVFDLQVQGGPGIDSHAHTFIFQPGIALKPAASVYISLTPTYDADENPAQYVTTVADPAATAFYGRRYVFSFIRTHTLSLDTRVNWTFTPNLTLQVFAQPYIATGDYESFREFAAPRTLRKLVYGKDVGTIVRSPTTPTRGATYTVDPDGGGPAAAFTFADPSFTYRSLIGNAVIRWEFRPGSTVFFVWTQNRTGNEDTGNFNFTKERSAFFRDRPTNVFQIKVNYWIGR